MSLPLLGGLALALASAGALNIGFFVQHGAASALPALALRRPIASLRLLFGSARWLAGFVAGIGGWALYATALALAPLSLVQAASAGGIGLLALLVSRVAGVRLRPWERWGVAVAVLGLALLAGSLAGPRTHGTHGAWTAVAAWVAASAPAAALAAGPLARRLVGGAGLGLAAGILYAAGDVATKAAVAGGGRLAFVPVLLACHGLAFVALQLGFQRGGALATAGVATLFTNALPIAAGTTIFGEGFGAEAPVRGLAFACVVTGATLLARPGPEAVDSDVEGVVLPARYI
ncbi:MAG TPA: hypothetical protein VE753_05905 [Gaiellaceae bacterium]|nr:hypothetical protein [Gaiellaceae bacterium]